MRMKKKLQKKIIAACLTVGMAISSFSMASLAVNAEENSVKVISKTNYSGMTIKNNVKIDGVSVGGMSYQDALLTVNAISEKYKNVNVTLSSDIGTVTTTLASLGYADNHVEAVRKAISTGNTGDILKRYKELKSLEISAIDIAVDKSINGSMLEDVVNEQLKDVLNQSGSGINFTKGSNGKVSVTAEDSGVGVNIDATCTSISEIMTSEWTGTDISANLVIDEDGVSARVQQLSEITDLLGEYTTDYSSASGRMKNIERATELINGTILYPGDAFSTSAAMGPRTSGNGYYTAGQYVGGRLVDGVGGGVCQVATTLYNAVIRSELKVTQRSNHGMSVSYVPLSSDAAIAGNALDLKFVNNLDSPIYIEGSCSGGNVTYRIYGKEYRPSNRKIEFESKTIKKIEPGADVIEEDPTLAPGKQKVMQKAHIGYVAELWKNVYIDGQLTESVQVNSSKYKATPKYIAVGPGEAVTEAPATEAVTEAPPATEAVTEAPTTQAPTEAPTTQAPTEAPATEAPPYDPGVGDGY